MNSCFLVGRLVEKPEIKTTTTGLKLANLILDVEKNFRSQNGELEIERYSCTIWRAVAESVIENCEVGDVVAVRGRLQANNYLSKDQVDRYNCEIIAESVSVLR